MSSCGEDRASYYLLSNQVNMMAIRTPLPQPSYLYFPDKIKNINLQL